MADPGSSDDGLRDLSDAEAVRSHLELLRELVLRGLLGPVDLVMITRSRVQEVMDEAVERGRITRHDADRLVLEIVARGRRETDEIVSDLERLLERGLEQLGDVAAGAGRRALAAVDVASADRVRRTVQRARRAVGELPPGDDALADLAELPAREVIERIAALEAEELAQVREREQEGKARATVLRAVDRRLGALRQEG